MRILIAVALFAGGLLALHTPAVSADAANDAAKKRSAKSRTEAATVQRRTYSRQERDYQQSQRMEEVVHDAGLIDSLRIGVEPPLQGMRAECSDNDGESQEDGADNTPIHT